MLSPLLFFCLTIVGCGKSDGNADSGKASSAETGTATVPQVTMIQSAPRIVIEAETAKIEPPMKIGEDANASGGKFVHAPEGPDHKEISVGGSATFDFQVKTAGDYLLWIRKNWCCGCGNSLTISVDKGKEITFGGDATYQRWDWKRVPDPAKPGAPLTLHLTEGPHNIKVGNREDGSKFDQMLLTQDNEYVPVAVEKE